MSSNERFKFKKDGFLIRVWDCIKKTYDDIKYCQDKIIDTQFKTIEVDVVYLDDYELYYETPTGSYGSNYKSTKAKKQKRDISGKFIKGYTE